MKLIVGLGNPGQDYKGTRHNIGFAIIDKIAEDLKLGFKRDSISCSYLTKDLKKEIILAKPITFMNLSGQAVAKLTKNHKIELENLLVVYDDVDLEFCRIKLDFSASSGGHRGLQSVIDCLGSRDFCRLRFGIGSDKNKDTSNFVLSKFKKTELKEILVALDDAAEAVMFWQEFGIVKAMEKYNKKKE